MRNFAHQARQDPVWLKKGSGSAWQFNKKTSRLMSKWIYRVFRGLLVTAILLGFVVPAGLYVALSLGGVQRGMADAAERELSALLAAKVTIGKLNIAPFNRVMLSDVVVETAPGDTALYARDIGAGVDLWSAVRSDIWTVNYVAVMGLRGKLWRDSIGAPLNIQPLIDALSPKDKSKPPTKFSLRVPTVILRSCSLSYDVRSEPLKEEFDANHIGVSNLRADIVLPRLSNDDYACEVKRLGFDERSGFSLSDLKLEASLGADGLSVDYLSVELPDSRLEVEPLSVPLNGLKNLGGQLKEASARIAVKSESAIWLPDLGAFANQLKELPMAAVVETLAVDGSMSRASVDIGLAVGDNLSVDLAAKGTSLGAGSRSVEVSRLSLRGSGSSAAEIVSAFRPLKDKARDLLAAIGNVELAASGKWTPAGGTLAASATTGAGALTIDADAKRSRDNMLSLSAHMLTDSPVNLAIFFPGSGLGSAECDAEAKAEINSGKIVSGSFSAAIPRIEFRGDNYSDLTAEAALAGDAVAGRVAVEDPDLSLWLEGSLDGISGKGERRVGLKGELARCYPDRLRLWNKYPGATLSGNIDIALHGSDWNRPEGHALLSNVSLTPAEGKPFLLKELSLTSETAPDGTVEALLRSDYIDGSLRGTFDFKTLPKQITGVLAASYPSLLPGAPAIDSDVFAPTNDFALRLDIKSTEELATLVKLPVSVIYPATVNGSFSSAGKKISLDIDAPYLRQGNKLVERSDLSLEVSGADGSSSLLLSTLMPTKNGPMTLSMDCAGAPDRLKAGVSWNIDRPRAYEGSVGVSASFSRHHAEGDPQDGPGRLRAVIDLRRSALTFNDSTWTINPATVTVSGRTVKVDGINVHHGRQFVKIDGEVSDNPLSALIVDVRDFSLDYLFETLGIDKVSLGGSATGTFYASGLYTKRPALLTPGLSVKNISYNKAVFGDALVRSRWDAERNAVTLDASITRDDRLSEVHGGIFPMADSLDLTFLADRVPARFMQPYMAAFASEISGEASGRARLWGNFKYIDLEGDVKASDLKMRVNFTNTVYSTSDSVHFRPGLIDLDGITIKDARGRAAKLDGWVRHKYFKEPRFNFAITQARDFLCYDETAERSPVWYGRVYGNGSAAVSGEPGVVNIKVDMTTAPNTTFTFVLSDRQVAEEYSFLTFRDRTPALVGKDTLIIERDPRMDLVNSLRQRISANQEGTSDYNISLVMNVTPQARLILVMDPVGGDRIRALGSGQLQLDYGSANNDLKMYGTYTLDRGDYNFTLQDIIIKDFTIRQGSQIAFRGDPYSAQLDIKAAYTLNANLSDLDESFLEDKDLNRTSVPVNALMNVSGDMRQPDVSFDLEFPTLTSDVYRKVRSIVSTDDMMNRQIIYLLALNRFYTPDYMASTTKGNELVSVASSTISSQLSSLLGQISDNWNIAPSFRSDRGDFSDVEVDLALSSRLLNNRLLFNGNFGYRDKTLNTSQFVGDFDLEYLLNRSGNLRLKAYNRYNDQNYYLRTSPTTQGVGIIFRRDFDNLGSFLWPFSRSAKEDLK